MRYLTTTLLFILLICTAGYSYDLDIHAMVVGDKALELVETNRLTSKADGEVESAWMSPDGKWVAYATGVTDPDGVAEDDDYRENAFLLASDGKRQIPLLPPTGSLLTGEDLPPDVTEEWTVSLPSSIFTLVGPGSPWSFDSRYIVAEAQRVLTKATQRDNQPADTSAEVDEESKEQTQENWYLVYDIKGRIVQSFRLRQGEFTLFSVAWSRDNRRFASTVHFFGPDEDSPPEPTRVKVFDIAQGSQHDIKLTGVTSSVYLFGWSQDGTSILYNARVGSSWELRERPLEQGNERIIIKEFGRSVSPDGRLRIVTSDKTLSIEQIGTGARTVLLKDNKEATYAWAPNSRFLIGAQSKDLSDFFGKRKTNITELWLVSMESHALNHLRLAPEADFFGRSASEDCRRIAYTSQGRLFVANLEWRDPTAWEKMSVGLVLTEEDNKTILLERADIIATALASIQEDPGEQITDANDAKKRVEEYLEDDRKEGLFLRPGDGKDVFTYAPPKDMDIMDPEKTAVGYLDAGYSWKVNIYADGHADVVQKQ